MSAKHDKALSKMTSHALRHEPWSYGLELDAEGWVSIDDLLVAFSGSHLKWCSLERADIEQMIVSSSKQRFEISGDNIRAMYGHSIPTRIEMPATLPPSVLYHGTAPETVAAIRNSGLLPMNRQRVHLSETREIAVEVGRRKSKSPVVLAVDTVSASQRGVLFYHGNENIWLSDAIPSELINFE